MDTQNLEANEVESVVDVTKMTQKEAVFQYTTEVLTESGLSLTDEVKMLLRTKKGALSDENKKLVSDLKSKIRAKLLTGLTSGAVVFNPEAKTPANKYCSGLLNNWLTKHENFK